MQCPCAPQIVEQTDPTSQSAVVVQVGNASHEPPVSRHTCSSSGLLSLHEQPLGQRVGGQVPRQTPLPRHVCPAPHPAEQVPFWHDSQGLSQSSSTQQSFSGIPL